MLDLNGIPPSGGDAYAVVPSRLYARLHSHQRRQEGQYQGARQLALRCRRFLLHGSCLLRLRASEPNAPSRSLLFTRVKRGMDTKHVYLIKTYRTSGVWCAKKDHHGRLLHRQRLPRAFTPNPIQGSRVGQDTDFLRTTWRFRR